MTEETLAQANKLKYEEKRCLDAYKALRGHIDTFKATSEEKQKFKKLLLAGFEPELARIAKEIYKL